MLCVQSIRAVVAACVSTLLLSAPAAIAQPCPALPLPPGEVIAANAIELAAAVADPAVTRIYLPCGNDYSLTAPQIAGSGLLVNRTLAVTGCGCGVGERPTIQGVSDFSINCDSALNGPMPTFTDEFRLFLVTQGTLTLENLHLTRGAALIPGTANGGAVWVQNNAALIMRNCLVEENIALNDGGALYVESGLPKDAVLIESCSFERNAALNQGGAIRSQRSLNLLGTIFECNIAGQPNGLEASLLGSGGAVYASNGTQVQKLIFGDGGQRPVFERNRAGNGGALYLVGSAGLPPSQTILEVDFFLNTASLDGGAIFAENDQAMFVAHSRFGGELVDCDHDGELPANESNGNRAGVGGGAFFCKSFSKSSPQFLACIFDGNSSGGGGGAVQHFSDTPGFYDHCDFIRNTAATNGGAADCRNSSRPSFNDCRFTLNTAGGTVGGRGGAVSMINGRATAAADADSRFYNCVFSRNSVAGPGAEGGTIYIDSASPAFLHCTIAYDGTGQTGVWAKAPSPLNSATPRPRFYNSIVYRACRGVADCENSLPLAFVEQGNVLTYLDVRYSDIRMPTDALDDFFVGVAGNINCDPLLELSTLANSPDDVHLTPCSPCIDRGQYVLSQSEFSLAPLGRFRTYPRPEESEKFEPAGSVGPEDFDFDDLCSVLTGFVNPQFEIEFGGVLPTPTDLIAPRVTTPRPLACEADMGADESIRDITDSITLFCDPASDGQPPFEIASADPCSPFGVGEACGPLCEGEQLCLTGVFDGLCPTGVVYQWYFRDDANNDPAFCGPLTTEFVPVVNNGRITGANTPNLCFTDVELCDTGCYRLIITRSTCGGPSRFFCAEDLATGLATSICGDELTVDVCISVYQAPEIQVHPLPATVCLGGTQNLCATVQVPVGCEPQCIWYRVVGTPDNVNTPGFPFDDVRVCPLQAPMAGITCNDTPLGGGLFACCLTFSPATINHIGDYYVVVTCGGLECSVQSDPAELEVIDPQPLVNNAAVCVGGRQCLEQVAVLPPLTPGSTYTYQWFRRPESDCLTTPCPAGDCSAGTPLTNSGPFSGVNTPVLCIDPASTALRGCYYVVVGIDGLDVDSLPDDGKCVSASNCACLTVIDPFPVVADAAVCLGGTQTLEQTATLPALPAGYTYTFQWFFRGTSNCLTTPCPAGQCGGGTTVSNGGRFSGANTPNLTITNAMAVDAGCYYISVGIDGPEGPAIDAAKCLKSSNCACLSVVNPQPVVNNAAVCLGGTQTLEQVASLPSLPVGYSYTYQWFFRGTSNCITTPCELGDCTGGAPVSNGGRFSGANTPNLTITGAFAADAGCYYVRVGIDGPEGPAIDAAKCIKASNCACLAVVNPLPTVNDAAVCLGGTQALEQTATLPSLPSGYAYTFQWFFRGTSNCITTPCPAGDCTGGTTVPNSGRFSGANTPTLTITNAMAADAGCYYIVVSLDGPEGPGQDGPKCAKASNCACLSVVNPQPMVANAAVCLGGTQALEQTATLPSLPSGYAYTFQWFFRGTSNCITTPCPAGDCTGGTTVPNSGRFSGANTPTLTITNAMAADAGCYYIVVSLDGPEGPGQDGPKCAKASNCACLSVVNPQPLVANAAACLGGTQTLEQTATLPPLPAGYTYTFQWFFRGTSNCITTPCPAGDCTGGTTVPNSGRFSGANTPNLTITGALAADAGCYYVSVGIDGPEGPAIDAGKCLKNSNCACLSIVDPIPLVANAAVCIGGTQTLEQTATLPTLPAGYTYTFQWFFRGTSNCIATPCPAGDCTGGTAVSNSGRFSGANTPSLTISNAMAIDAGCYYVSVGIDGPEGPAIDAAKCLRFSNCACLRVLPQPTFTLHPEPAAVCVGGRQTLTANVTNPGGLSLCLQWYRKTSCSLQGEGVPVVDGSGISGATTNTLTFDPASLDHEGCYYLRARLCEPNDLSKCPWVDSTCACLDVRLPLVPCVLECVSGESDSAGNCLFCPGVDITFCCDVVGAEGPVCYQWQFCADSGPAGCFIDIPSANSACFIIENFNPAIHTGCYRVRINYLDLSGGLGCPDSSDKCDAVYSLPICVAETDRCCPDVCDCKDNADPTQPFYALWKTGEWDGQSGEWSFDRSTTDGIVIKAADDFFLCPSSMHHITRFLGEMLVRQSNPLIEFQAKLFLYEDCDGQPGEQIAEFDSDCPAFVSGAPDGFTRYQVKFDLSEECFWLRGGTYWVSLVAIAPPADASFEAFWAGVGLPGTPPIPTVMGRQPVFMDGDNDWAEYDPCCHPCADLQFCLSGKSCPIMWDNGLPFLGGADSDSPPSPPFQVRGTRSEKSALPVRNSRAADQFIVKTCNPEEVCYLEGYIFTNCIGFEAHLEIYESDCRVPQFELPQASPVFYSAIADPANIIDLGYTGLQVGTTAVRAYKVIFCAFDPGLTFEPGRNYWVSLSVKDSFSANERAFFAHVKTPCDPCTEPYVWKVDPGMELAPGRQIPDWRSAGEDFAFLIATKKQPGTSPIGGPGEGDVCIADANNNNEIDVQDIFVFLSAWFAGCP